MNNLTQIIKAEFYKHRVNKIWVVSLIISIILSCSIIYRELQNNILTGLQIGTDGYNAYKWLIGSCLSFLALFILPMTLAICIFINIKQNENQRNWINGIGNYVHTLYITSKLLTSTIMWSVFICILWSFNLCTSLLIIKCYPQHFIDYEINKVFLSTWFLKYYLCSLGSLTFCFLMAIFIKNKTIILIISLITPFIFIFLSRKGYFFPLTYAYFSSSSYMYNYSNYLKTKTTISPAFIPEIIGGYEILSIFFFIATIAFIHIKRKYIVAHLTRA